MADQQVELVRELNRAFEQMDLAALSDVLHPDLVHVTRPSSVNVPKQNKAGCLEYYEKMFNNWTSVETPVSTILANTPGKIVAHVASKMTLKSGSTIAYESILAIETYEDPSGKKQIKYVEEFIDANSQAQGFAPFMAATT